MVLFYLSLRERQLRRYNNGMIEFLKFFTDFVGLEEEVVGIDIRPADNELYALTVDPQDTGRLYTIDPESLPGLAPATFIGVIRDTDMNIIPLSADRYGFDFDPTSDRIRIVGDNNQNLSADPVTAITFIQGDINFPEQSVDVFAVAYSNSPTTLYDIGKPMGDPDALFTQDPATGTLSQIGPLGIPVELVNAGFDISASNDAFAAITQIVPTTGTVATNLYSIDLMTGEASFVAQVLAPSATDLLTGFTLLRQIPPIPCLHPETLVHLPGSLTKAIKDLRAGDKILDFQGRCIELIHNVRFPASDSFYKIKLGAIDGSLPINDLIIRREHPILYNGKEIDAKKLQRILGRDKVRKIKLNKKIPVWSLATNERTFVIMEGIPVCTWASEDLIKETHKRKFIYKLY